jgi:2-oxoglutarate dehydrogenase E2 component (dihydrolipoamide succinyltransferase)
MPQLGETVTEGTITKWLKQVGDQVAEDDVLFEVSTDKVDSEVPSPVTGYIAEILVSEGETVDVGTKLAVISSDAPSTDAPTDAPGTVAPGTDAPATQEAEPQPEPDPAAEPEPEPAAELEQAQEPEPAPPPPAASVAPSSQRPPGGSPGSPASPGGGGGTRPADDRPRSAPGSGSGSGSSSGSGGGGPSKVLSPVVRRLIAEHGLDASQIEGSGAGGRITRDDVLALIDRKGTPTPTPEAAQPQPQPPPAATQPLDPVAAGQDDTVIPFTNIRRRTAEHMVRSKHTSAHTVVAMEIDYSAVEVVRQAEKERFKQHEGVSLTYLPFIARAVIDAIADWPNINSSVGDDALIVHNHINLGIAVDLNLEGLLVPVIHDAGDKRLRALAREVASLAERARSKRLTMDDISGGTFTLTNAGPFGTLFTIPVINQPQVAILATDGIRKKPVVVELPDGTDAIAIHPVGNLVLSFDHRAIDGAYASVFMRDIKDSLEHRDWSTEL